MQPAVERDAALTPCPFVVLDEIAAGGMGTVYRARATSGAHNGRLVALKRLHPHLARDAHIAETFVEEARILAGLRHPSVVGVVDYGVDGAGPYIALEYVAGFSVADVMREARARRRLMPLGVVARIVASTADALHAAHELRGAGGAPRDLVHRDVSPQNILVGADGRVVLIDFGVAKVRDAAAHTRTGVVKGKLAYMSPEQVKGLAIDRRTDVFALGVVLWELLTLHRLFRGETEMETFQKVLNDPAAPVGGLRTDLPPALDGLLFRALAKDPAGRVATAAEFAAELRRITAGEASDAAALAGYLAGLLPDAHAALRAAPDVETLDASMATAAGEPSMSQTRPRPPPAADDPTHRALRRIAIATAVALAAVFALGVARRRPARTARPPDAPIARVAQPAPAPSVAATAPLALLPPPAPGAQSSAVTEATTAAPRARRPRAEPSRRAATPHAPARRPRAAPRGAPSLLSREWQDE